MMNIELFYSRFTQSRRVVTDSRQVQVGDMYFALRGERFDGNSFAAAALAAGAAFVVIDNPRYHLNERCLLVADTLKALQDLARYHRQTFDIPVIGITGSNGKTTTKELIAAVLTKRFKTHFTAGNLNNHIGVPLTLLAMPRDTEMAVIEMGANHQREIAFLSNICLPTHGLITNIGKAHLEGFGGIEGVKKGKSELYEHLAAHRGTALVNSEQPFLADLAREKAVDRIVYYGTTRETNGWGNDYIIKQTSTEPFVAVSFYRQSNTYAVQSQLPGNYNYHNIAAAIAVGQYFGVPAESIGEAIAAYLPQNNRSQLMLRGSNTYLMDAYNANPDSMALALSHFIAQNKDKAAVAILGEMAELGSDAPTEHEAIVKLALNSSLQKIVLVGKGFEACQDLDPRLLYFEQPVAAKAWLISQRFEDTHFLLKGSRVNALEQLLD